MGGGILNGVVLGTVVSVVVLAAVSLSTPLPERAGPPAVTVEATAGNAATNAAAPAPAVGGTSEPGPDAGIVSPPEAAAGPQIDSAPEPAPETTPEPEAAAQPLPQPGATASAAPNAPASPAAADVPASLPRVDLAPQTPARLPQADAPVQDSAPERDAALAQPTPLIATVPDSPAPAVIASAPSPLFSTAADGSAGGTPPRRLSMPQAQAAPAATDTTAPAAPAPQPAARADTAAQIAPAPLPEAVPETRDPGPVPVPPPRLPQVTALPEAAPAFPPAPAVPGRLPQAGLSAMPAPAPEPVPNVETEPGPPNALRDNAEVFETEADAAAPLMAIVLIDEVDSGFDPGALGGLGFPVSFAINPMRPDAATRAAALRDAGFEVVMLAAPAIPTGASPGDVEVALSVAREALPQAVALMDDPASRIQGDRPVLDATVGVLAATGHGLIAFPRGLNAATETARRADVPAATVFRMLDDEDQSAPVITRFLGRAAFAAAQEGAVVVVGRTRPDTVTALLSWALGSRTEGVALAPVSAVLLRLSE